MQNTAKLIFAGVLMTAAALAQSQVATVTSSSPFTLRGAKVNTGQGVPQWPVLAGDSVKAGNTPVIVTFPDGSTITLDPGTEATVSFSGKTPVFHLVKGSASYSLKTLTSVQIISGNQTVTVADLTGSVATKAGGRSTAMIVGAGAAAGLGVGLAQATSGGQSVSPSH